MDGQSSPKTVIGSPQYDESLERVFKEGLVQFEKPHVPQHHPRFAPYHLPHRRGTDRGIGHRPFRLQHAEDQEDEEYPHRIIQRKASHPQVTRLLSLI